MRLSGYNGIRSSFGKGSFPPSGQGAGSSFLDEVRKASNAASVEKAVDSLQRSDGSAQLNALYDRLTPASKDLLERIRAGTDNITKDEWNGLCKELETLGAISEADYQCTRADFHFIPLGYWGEDGEFVKYELPTELANKLLSQASGKQSPSEDGLWACLDDSSWKGDPLAYLDNWMSSLYSWRSDLARMRNGDGSPKYSNFSPITNQINACQKVAALVRELRPSQI